MSINAVFAYYHEFDYHIASYLIIKSNYPNLPEGGNVGADQLTDAGIEIPKTPDYEKWVKDGRFCFRGK